MSDDAHFPYLGLVSAMPHPQGKPTLEEIVRTDGRHPVAAYLFVFEALDYAATLYDKDRHSPREEERHVTGQQLLEGIRRYALEQFGSMAKTVFDELGIRTTEDFGRIVFFLVSHGMMGKTERDVIDDFVGQYDLEEAFDRGFVFALDDDVDLAVPTPYYRPR